MNATARSGWGTLIAVSIAAFMLLLDVTVVNVALPEIQTDLGADFTDLQWVIDAYALTLAATMLVFGSLGDRLGRRRIFTVGLTIFSLASLACGLAWDPTSLNVFRGLQGLGGAAMLASSLALIAGAYSGSGRNFALAVWGATTAAAVALGPLIGGALVEAVGWESIFFVNVPIGIVTALLVARSVPETRDPDATGPLDFAGLATLSGSMSLLVVALFRGSEEGWGSALILGLLAGAAVLLAAFVAAEARARRPLLDLSLFRLPTTSGASVAMLAIAISVFAVLTYLVLFIQNSLGYDALATGLRLFPLTIASFFAAMATARMMDRVPIAAIVSAGLTLAAAGSLLISIQVEPASDWTALLLGGILIGAGAGLINPSVSNAALGAAPAWQSGMASGLNNTFRLLGVAIGVAALGSILDSEVTASLNESLGAVPPGLADIVATGNIEAAVASAPEGAGAQIGAAARDAFVGGFETILLVAAVVASVGAVLALALIRSDDLEREAAEGASGQPSGEAPQPADTSV